LLSICQGLLYHFPKQTLSGIAFANAGHTIFADAAMSCTPNFPPHWFTLLFAGGSKPLPTHAAHMTYCTPCACFIVFTQLLPTRRQWSLLPPMGSLDSVPLPFVAAACLLLVKPDWHAVYRQGGG